MKKLIPFLGIVTLLSPGCFDSQPRGMGALEDNLLEGNEAGWTGHLTDQGYRLSNATSAGAIKYLFMQPQREDRGSRYAVRVAINSTYADAAAGLLYAFDNLTGVYYAFLVRSQGVYLLRRGPGGVEICFETTPEGWVASEEHRLEIRARGQWAQFRVDGRIVSSLSNDDLGGGAVGILAVGRGDFFFRDFQSPPPVKPDEGELSLEEDLGRALVFWSVFLRPLSRDFVGLTGTAGNADRLHQFPDMRGRGRSKS